MQRAEALAVLLREGALADDRLAITSGGQEARGEEGKKTEVSDSIQMDGLPFRLLSGWAPQGRGSDKSTAAWPVRHSMIADGWRSTSVTGRLNVPGAHPVPVARATDPDVRRMRSDGGPGEVSLGSAGAIFLGSAPSIGGQTGRKARHGTDRHGITAARHLVAARARHYKDLSVPCRAQGTIVLIRRQSAQAGERPAYGRESELRRPTRGRASGGGGLHAGERLTDRAAAAACIGGGTRTW
nr:unnamed protein product [Digitaria exilis]